MNLTQKAIETAQPGAADRWLMDHIVRGFGVRVQPSGRKTFVLRYRNSQGRSRKYTIARCSDLSLTEARDKARSLFVRIREGFDPCEAKIEARDAPTIRDLSERYMRDHAWPFKKPRSAANDERLWELHILPAIGEKRIRDVKRPDVVAFLAGMRERPINGNRALAVLSKAFSLAVDWEWADTNPCRGVKRYRENKRMRVLAPGEIRRLMQVLDAYPNREFVRLVKLLLLTGCRVSEIRDARREWVDFERRVLELPDSKTGQRTIALPRAAVELLQEVDGVVYRLPNLWFHWRKVRKDAGLEGVRLHDLRHTVGSMGHKAGLTLREIAMLLGHRQLSTTERYVHGFDGDDVRAADKVAEAMGL